MIDIHSHILPGVDDGARTVKESLEMLEQAAAAGTTAIVATPHASTTHAFHRSKVEAAFRVLIDQTRGLVKAYLGCEFQLTYDNLRSAIADHTPFSINGGRYLLVELPPFVPLSIMENALLRLIDQGVVPIITHPERTTVLHSRPDALRRWIMDGCLVQVTGQSLSGRFGKMAQRSAYKLIDDGLVHFVASDAHDGADRTTDLSPAYRWVLSRHGERRANELFIVNPTAALFNRDLPGVASMSATAVVNGLGYPVCFLSSTR